MLNSNDPPVDQNAEQAPAPDSASQTPLTRGAGFTADEQIARLQYMSEGRYTWERDSDAVRWALAEIERLRETLRSDRLFLRRFLERIIHVAVKDERGYVVNGFGAAQIPDWEMRQRVDDIEHALGIPAPVADGVCGDLSGAESSGVESEKEDEPGS